MNLLGIITEKEINEEGFTFHQRTEDYFIFEKNEVKRIYRLLKGKKDRFAFVKEFTVNDSGLRKYEKGVEE